MNEVMWYLIRATGTVAYILLYLSVMLGLLAMVYKEAKTNMKNIMMLHEPLGNWALIVTMGHFLFLFLDSYKSFTLKELLIPFATTYEPLAMALGIFALYFLVATVILTKFRKKIGMKLWKKTHILTPVLYVIVTIHAVMIGTDFKLFTTLLLQVFIPFCMFSLAIWQRFEKA